MQAEGSPVSDMRTSEYHGVKAEKVERGLFYNVFSERDL
jgi:hypothetical protein